MNTEARIKYLERKFNTIKKVKMRNPKFDPNKPESGRNQREIETDVETKYRNKFERFAQYMGNGVYEWQGVKARDTRVLFLKGVLYREGVKFKEDDD